MVDAQALGGAPDPVLLLAQLEADPADEGYLQRLLALGADAAAIVASRFPGTLRFGHRKLHTLMLPLPEHGLLIGIAPHFGSPMVPLLLPRLGDPSADTRFYAALVFSELRSDEAVPALGQRVFDGDAAVRRAATMALGRYPPSQPLRTLIENLRNELVGPDPNRQRHAAMAIGELRDGPSVPRLIDHLKHRDMETVDQAHRALMVITKQDFGTTRWRWRSWWEKNRDQSRLAWLFAGLEQPSEAARHSAVEELQALATDRFGCHAGYPRREREEAVRRWAAFAAKTAR
jgi:HEAT repeat protein